MTSTVRKFLTSSAAAIAASAMLVVPSQAQQVYRIVGADGKVTFSDKPPPPATNAKRRPPIVSVTGASANFSRPRRM